MVPAKVVFVSGPNGAGKTRLVHFMVEEAMRVRPHHIRLVRRSPVGQPYLELVQLPDKSNLASSRRIDYDPDCCCETLNDAIQALPSTGPVNIVLVEGDGDPCLRWAYPYDRRIFVMPAPDDVYDVFRTPEQAAVALKKVMEDTASFATEIFGLFDEKQVEQETGLMLDSGSSWTWDRSARHAVEVSEADLRKFIDTPLGMEIASRIQLQPEYHGLVESDVILINMAVGRGHAVDEVSRRLELLLSRIRSQAQNDGLLFCCDPCEREDPRRIRLFEKLCLMHHALAS